ncbi:MAG TPA: DUF2480 family protein [Saprospiraceae bacterium]|nr:DUF2480 family protein [Saprospiraceae bacterium]
MDTALVNRVANSGLITFNLEDYYPTTTFAIFDIKDYLFQGLILKGLTILSIMNLLATTAERTNMR